jgi:nicotinamidase-related amidase
MNCISGRSDSKSIGGFGPGSTVVALIDPSNDRLTTDNACILLVDHQIGPLWELEFAESRRRVVELATLARRLNLPTIITAIGLETLGPIIPELTAANEEAPHLVRSEVNAWNDHGVRGAIEGTGRKKLIIAGSAAHVGLALCAKSAADAGYDVYAPIDASAQFSHAASVWLSLAGVILTTVSLVTAELETMRARRRRPGGMAHEYLTGRTSRSSSR